MKSKKYAILSWIGSSSCLIGVLILNYQLAQAYLSATGKTRALFGLVELSLSGKKTYLLPVAILSIGFGFLALTNESSKNRAIASIAGGLVSILALCIPLWKYMI